MLTKEAGYSWRSEGQRLASDCRKWQPSDPHSRSYAQMQQPAVFH